MNCQNCDAPVLVSDERCEKCGAKLLHRRVFLGAAKTEDFTLTGDEPARDLDDALAEEDFGHCSKANWRKPRMRS